METIPEEEKRNSKDRQKDLFSAFRNSIYLTSSKAFIAFLIAVLTFFCASQVLDVIVLYTKKESYVVNVFTQGPRFNYEESEPFEEEVKTAFENILTYSLQYQDPEGFSNPDMIRFILEEENDNCKKQIETVIEILRYQTAHNEVDEEYLKDGFVSVNNDGAYTINETAVQKYYREKYDALIENRKRVDEDYNAVVSYIESLNSVYFAVFDRENNRLVSNAPVSTNEEAQKYFSSLENCLMVFNSKSPYYVPGSLQNLFPVVQELSDEFGKNFDLFVSFSGGLIFDDNCKSIENNYKEVYSDVSKRLILTAVFGFIGIFLAVVLLRISGHREHEGAIKYALSDKLPNDLHILVHILIAASMLILTENSVYLILNPHLNTTWLTLSPEYFVARAEICSTIFVLFTLAAICCIKRHWLHKTLFTNTIIYKAFDAIRKVKKEK